MCNILKFIKRPTNNSGFTVLELAIVLVLVGIVIAPAIHLYQQHRIQQDWEETEQNIDSALNEIGGFRAVFGRYPCPAEPTAVPGDTTYGHELADCLTNAPAPGSCANGLCTYTNALSGENVVVGSIPFKTLNLQETEAYDRFLSRLTYAVTLDLTDSASFDLNGGGISIVDNNDPTIPLVSPQGSAHFIVLSHGRNQAGSYSRQGQTPAGCLTGSTIEQENCDANAVFTSGDFDENNFDDRISFFSAVTPAEWQTSQADLTAIHLKNTNSMAIGAQQSIDLSAADQTTVLDNGNPDSGSVRATERFVAESLCEYNASNPAECFEPELIAGTLVDSGANFSNGTDRLEASGSDGMSCPPGQYMTGIANKGLQCVDELFVTCPGDSFIERVDPDGTVRCTSGALQNRCNDTPLTTTCGTTFTVAETHSGGHSAAYSGECRRITDRNAAFFEAETAGMTFAQVEAFIDTLNAEPRTIEACGPNPNNAQIRDAFLCTNGTFSSSPTHTHEKDDPWDSFATSLTSGNVAETNNDSTLDPNNTESNHDCWCREDYRARQWNCVGGLAGNRIVIQEHRCPQTSHRWHTVYTNTSGCACTPTTTETTQSCNNYYDEINGTSGTSGLVGNVIKTFDVTCNGNGNPVQSATPTSVDASACRCTARADIVNRTACPANTTNNWTWPGGTEVAVAALSTQEWVCPTTTTGGLPDPGFWGDVEPYSPIPACACDNTRTDIVVDACPDGQEGTGIRYRREWDCTLNGGLGDWEPRADWEFIDNNCNGCSWRAPDGAPSIEEFAYGVAKGGNCSCGESPAAFCHDFAGGGDYSVWTGCPCVVKSN